MASKFTLKLRERNRNYERVKSSTHHHTDNRNVCDIQRGSGTLGYAFAASFLAQQNKRFVNSKWYNQIKTIE